MGRGTARSAVAGLTDSERPLHHASHGPPPHGASLHREDDSLLLSHRVGNRILVAAASPEARALGLCAGMALTQARAMVPDVAVEEADPGADAAWLESLALFAARRWTPSAVVSPPDGLLLDLTGVSHLFGGEERMARRLVAFCARLGFTVRIAVAGTLGAAHALARYGRQSLILCPPGGEAEALAPLPLACLRLDQRALATARRVGLTRVEEVLAMPRAPLGRRFGRAFLDRLDQALGRLAEPVEPVAPRDSPFALLRFVEPIVTAEAIGEALGELVRRLVATLGKAGLAARTLTLLCERVDGKVESQFIGTARPTRDSAHLTRLLAMKIEKVEPGFGIEAMRLVAGRCEPLHAQPVEGALAGERPAPDLAPLVDRLATRLGRRRLFRIGALESDVPERSVARAGPLDPVASWPAWPRPVCLLAPPERVENVVALLPDLPPRRFTWRGRAYRIARADGPERIHGEWWRRLGEAEAVRDYFQVEDEEGARFWLYRRGDGLDPRTGDLSWYLHGVFG
jgi:protein ImuB